jgi:hypothetical protein
MAFINYLKDGRNVWKPMVNILNKKQINFP